MPTTQEYVKILQTGGSGPYFRGSRQYGYGLRGLFTPLLRGALNIGKRALIATKPLARQVLSDAAHGGINVLKDVAAGENFGTSLKHNAKNIGLKALDNTLDNITARSTKKRKTRTSRAKKRRKIDTIF